MGVSLIGRAVYCPLTHPCCDGSFPCRHFPITFPELVLLLVEKVMVCASEVKSICSSCESEKEEKDIKKVDKMCCLVETNSF